MSFYDNPKNVESYIQMAEGYDGQELIAVLAQHLPAGSTVLELGMGPGKDLELLAEHFTVTGSDASTVFLDRYRQQRPEADLLLLDAVALETDRRFDAIYSNKVLHHLSVEELRLSLRRQATLLNPGGFLLHSFWAGEGTEEMQGLQFTYHTEQGLRSSVGPEYAILDVVTYREMEADDSLYLLLQRATNSRRGGRLPQSRRSSTSDNDQHRPR